MTERTAQQEEKILRAARDLFFEHGYGAVSTDMLAKEASVSKSTLYKHFPSTAALLKAVCEEEGRKFKSGVNTNCETLEQLRDNLTDFGTNLLRFLNDPLIIRFTSLIHEQARANPETTAAFFDSAYNQTLSDIGAMFSSAREHGAFRHELTDEELAEQLLGAWESTRWLKAVMGLSRRPFQSPRDWAGKGVSTILASTKRSS